MAKKQVRAFAIAFTALKASERGAPCQWVDAQTRTLCNSKAQTTPRGNPSSYCLPHQIAAAIRRNRGRADASTGFWIDQYNSLPSSKARRVLLDSVLETERKELLALAKSHTDTASFGRAKKQSTRNSLYAYFAKIAKSERVKMLDALARYPSTRTSDVVWVLKELDKVSK